MKLLLALFGLLKLGKVFTTGGTMLISVFAYALVWGWPYAVGFVALLFAHEMGHFIAARQRGLNVGAPTFIPFLGAWINMKDMPHNAETEAYVGLGGPFVGSLAAFACYYAALHFHSELLLAVSYSGFFLNLFNLIPVSPLDGGRITAVLGAAHLAVGRAHSCRCFSMAPEPSADSGCLRRFSAGYESLALSWRR